MTENLYVQYGCGLSAPRTWQNFDCSPSLRLQRLPLLGRWFLKRGPPFPPNVRYGDIVQGLPIERASCTAVYCSHVLEHLALKDFRIALRHTLESLCPGGTFRFVLPDLEALAREYVASAEPDAAIKFLEASYLGQHSRPHGLSGFVREWLGNANHRWMWDEKSMLVELKIAGFDQIRRAAMGDSKISQFADVEDRGRWDGCLGMDCIRPA